MKWIYTNILIIVVAFVLSMCLFLDDVEYPSTLQAGEEATFVMKVRVDAAENSDNVRLVVGYLVPKNWNAAANTKITYTTSVEEGTFSMSVIPKEVLPKNGGGVSWSEGIFAKYGYGPNVLEDMEWIVYYSDKAYNVANGEDITADVTIKTKISNENMRVKLGFFVNHTNDGLSSNTDHFKVNFTDCIDVVGAEGTPIDFCELHFNSSQPLMATNDDILTFRYQGNIGSNVLDGVEDIYFCSRAITSNGNIYMACEKKAASKMVKESQYGRTFGITIWPADYYAIAEGETIARIEYSFTNADGTIVLEDANEEDNTTQPFAYTFLCN